MKAFLSPKQVAQALGVSESSLKRWCDRGLLTTQRTAGGHRRVPVEQVVQFVRQSRQPIARPEILGLPPRAGSHSPTLAQSQPLFRDALLAGDLDQARRLALDLYLAGHSVVELGDGLISPAFLEIGSRWAHGTAQVYQERRGVEICLRILHEIRSALPPVMVDAPLALGATVEGDPYQLASLLVEMTFTEAGWNARSYGTNLPLSTLAQAVIANRPRLVWLSISHLIDPTQFVTEYADFYRVATESGAAVVLGGRALSELLRRQLQYTAFCDGLRHLQALAASLWRPTPAATATMPGNPPGTSPS